MHELADPDLLRQYAEQDSEPAFAAREAGHRVALRDERLRRACRRPRGRAANCFRRLARRGRGILEQNFGAFTQGYGAADGLLDGRVVEIHIRHRHEQRFEQEPVKLRVLRAEPPRAVRVLRDALGRVDEQVLEDGGGLGFAADREIGAAGAFGGLFTLKAEHNFLIGFVVVWLRRHRGNASWGQDATSRRAGP